METFFSLFQGPDSYITVPIIVLSAAIIGALIGNYLVSVPPKPRGTLSRDELPPAYTIDNVVPQEVYFVEYQGGGFIHRQEFQVLQVKKGSRGFFLIGVYYPGGQGQGQGHYAFKGWTRKIATDQKISPHSLIQEEPWVAAA